MNDNLKKNVFLPKIKHFSFFNLEGKTFKTIVAQIAAICKFMAL